MLVWLLTRRTHWLGSCQRSFRTLTSDNDDWCSVQRPKRSVEVA